MFLRRLRLNFKFLQNSCGRVPQVVQEFSSKSGESDANTEVPLGAASTKYKVFRDEDSEVVLDVIEERFKYQNLVETEGEMLQRDQYEGINLKRKIHYESLR